LQDFLLDGIACDQAEAGQPLFRQQPVGAAVEAHHDLAAAQGGQQRGSFAAAPP
jgi:hypothetical protein